LKEEKEPRFSVSVLITTRNSEKSIESCITSILNQTFAALEIIVVDEFDSNHRTKEIIESFNDKRLRYFKNKQLLGITKSRNQSLKYSKGDYVFFTDSDCVVSQHWVEQGLLFLKNNGYVGVEGKSYYISKDYYPTYSDHTYAGKPGSFMTNNIAYKKIVLKKIGGFDERYNCHEDRDLGLRALNFGKIGYNPEMLVYVQKETLTPKKLLNRANAIRNRVYLFKRFGDKELLTGRIVDVKSLMKILCPPFVFACLLFNRFETSDDYRIVPYAFVYALFERLKLWKECAKERVFLI
jgi:glycosyltransferase involved in cell wall biosynthesis